ncbi:MAG: hypothetical protein ACR2I2_14740 [Bryobacteraceae bacterium]
MKIVNAGVHRMEDGPAVSLDTQFVAGETIYIGFQLEGYRVAPDQKVHLSYKIDAFDPKGTKIVESVDSSVDAGLSPEDKNWKPKVHLAILIPDIAPPGKYRIDIRAIDDLDRDTASQDIPFSVSGREVPSSPALSVANFGFYRSEEDATPLKTAAYRPGEALWAKFDMVGYKFGERNSVNVSYDVAVLSSNGKTLYSQQEAAVEKSFSFYPKPYIPGTMNLKLQPNTRTGEYTILLTVHDLVGPQDYATKQAFRVE